MSNNLIQKTSQNNGHDLISPITIPKKFNGCENIKSLKKMIMDFRALNSESITVTDYEIAGNEASGVVITIK